MTSRLLRRAPGLASVVDGEVLQPWPAEWRRTPWLILTAMHEMNSSVPLIGQGRGDRAAARSPTARSYANVPPGEDR